MTNSFSTCPSCQSCVILIRSRKQVYECEDCGHIWPIEVTVTTTVKPIKVFLSYGHDDACCELVKRIQADLESRSINVWVDKERIEFGDEWRHAITDGLKTSSHVIAFLSKHSTRKPGVCRQEIAIALGPLKSHVYTVLVEPLADVTPPLIVSHMQWLDMQDWRTLKIQDPKAYELLYQQGLAEILRVIDRNEPFAGEVEELQKWLKPMDCTSDMIAAEEGFSGREWLLGKVGETNPDDAILTHDKSTGEIERWRTDGSPRKIFWIAADPGWGKSAVSARLAHASRARVMAVHFCKYDLPERRDARCVVRSIAFQMATQLTEFRILLVEEARKGTSLDDKNSKELFHTLLANPLAHVIAGDRGPHDRHLIVLDAIDETLDADGRSDLLTLVSSEFGKLPSWLGLLVTSRPESPVIRQLGSFGVYILKANDPRNLHDVNTYTEKWLKTLPLNLTQQTMALELVNQAGQGNFLYIRQLERSVLEGILQPEQLTQDNSLPKGLASLYERWFLHRFKDPSIYKRVQRPFLELMLASREPLPIKLAKHILKWGAYGEGETLDPLGSLCVKSGSENGTITFFHKSLMDWLADAQTAGRHWRASEEDGHRAFAIGLWPVYQVWKKAEGRIEQKEGFEELGNDGHIYALRHLPSHLKLSGMNEEREIALTDFAFAMHRCARDALENLLEDYYGELYTSVNSPLRSWADCIGTQSYKLRKGLLNWPAYKILLQIAIEHANDSHITFAAQQWLELGLCNWVWVRRVNRPSSFQPSPLLSVMEGHDQRVTGANILSDGRILSWSDNYSDGSATIRIWDRRNGALLANMRGHTKGVRGARILLDGRVLSWSQDSTIRFWDVQSGEPLGFLEGHTLGVEGTIEMSNGRLLSWAGDDTLCIWDLKTGIQLAVMKGHTTRIGGAILIPGGRVLSWSGDKTLRLWDGQSGESLAVMTGHNFSVRGACLMPDDRLLSWSTDDTLRTWNLQTGEQEVVMEGHSKGVNGAELLPDGRVLSWSNDKTLILWDDRSGEPLTVFTGHSDVVNGACQLADGRILSWSSDGTLRFWSDKNGEQLILMDGHTREVRGVEILPDGKILSWSVDGTLRLWDDQGGEILAIFEGHNRSINGAFYLPDQKILSWSDDETLRLWDANPQNISISFPCEGHSDTICGLKPLPDNSILSWALDGTIRIWDPKSCTQLAMLEGHTAPVVGVKELPSGRLISWSDDGTLRLWSWQNSELLVVMNGHTGAVSGVYLLPEDKLLSFSKDEGTIRLWDSLSGESIAVLAAHSGKILGTKLLGGGRVLSWSWDSLCLWDGVRGSLISVLVGHTKTVKDACEMPDGRLLTWANDNTMCMWNGNDGSKITVFEGNFDSVKVLRDGRILAWGLATILIWDGQNSASPKSIYDSGSDAQFKGSDLLHDGRIMFWRSDGSICLWDGHDGSEMTITDGPLMVHPLDHGEIIDVKLIKDDIFISWNKSKICLWGLKDFLEGGIPIIAVNQPWLSNLNLPTPWSQISEDIAGARCFEDIWTQKNKSFLVFANQSSDCALWHGEIDNVSCILDGRVVCKSGSQMIFLQLMRGSMSINGSL